MYLFTLIIGTSILAVVIEFLKTQIRKENDVEINKELHVDSDKTAGDIIDEK